MKLVITLEVCAKLPKNTVSSARSRNCPAYESCTAANIVFSSDHRRSASSRKADPFVKK